LDGLRILQLLDQLHLQDLHLHYFLLLERDYALFLLYLLLDHQPRLLDLALSSFFNLQLCNLLLRLNLLLLHLILVCDVLQILVHSTLVLLRFEFGLLRFLLFWHCDRLHDFLSFLLVLKAFPLVSLSDLLLFKLDSLHVINLGGDALVVSLLQPHHFLSPLFRFFDLLPGAHFFLFEERYAICKQLGVFLDS